MRGQTSSRSLLIEVPGEQGMPGAVPAGRVTASAQDDGVCSKAAISSLVTSAVSSVVQHLRLPLVLQLQRLRRHWGVEVDQCPVGIAE